ncbi:hypothetical protein G3A56_21090 [Rhizobium oryzihabitans]|uniref:Uncharacterized protein n=1 Tax=Rhizobium oryzihabitans TaxID=2267833 RepID=A0A7L5BND0_9HYPH|nr:hypothetical protein [Rhizobium oryzihabitans]QCM07374.1 hypothetical protein CFBP6626_18670 [Agrobacterium tumefaciens]QIB40379.1 hypothetical protein G3A56_21090 [Rhizobium oryzihabitans]
MKAKISDFPIARFPMNHDTYCRLRNEIGSIAARFSDFGTRDGAAVAKRMEKVHAALGDAWELIREIEQREDTH